MLIHTHTRTTSLPLSLYQYTHTPPSLDATTDAHIQKLLRSKFPSHTLIAVVHKLNTILDFDKVVVMNQGQLVEYGEPYKLLERQGSWFKSLYEDGVRVQEPTGEDDILEIGQ